MLSAVPRLTEEQKLEAFSALKTGSMTVKEVSGAYNIGTSLTTDLKFLRGQYSYMKEQYGLEPIPELKKSKITPYAREQIKKYIRSGASVTETMEKFNISSRTVSKYRNEIRNEGGLL